MIKVISWNIDTRREPWRQLVQMDADVALLQKARPPPDDIALLRDAGLPSAKDAGPLEIGPREAWDSHSWNSDWWRGSGNALFDRWPMVVRLSDRVDVEWFKQVGPTGWSAPDEMAVSGIGTIAAARITSLDDSTEPFIAVSMYGRWVGSHPSVKTAWEWGYADASAHRIISDLSTFIGHVYPYKHRILAAGDLNILHGYGLGGSPYWAARDRTVFDRMASLKLSFVGPQDPHGRQADPWPDHMPSDSKNVPTYYHSTQSPSTATLQLDYVFASEGFSDSVSVRALNSPEEWGPSDHCRLEILVS